MQNIVFEKDDFESVHFSNKHFFGPKTHTHTHTYIYKYIYIYKHFFSTIGPIPTKVTVD